MRKSHSIVPPLLHALPIGTLILTLGLAPTPPAQASEPLDSAIVDRIVNLVTVELQQSPPQTARLNDTLAPQDRLHTGQTSLAQMVFNDSSLVRVGQNSTFTFTPDSRQFELQEGVMMMVTPPGAGGAEIVTPTAIAGVQGSLLTVTARTRDDGKPTALISTFTSPAQIRNRQQEVIGELQPRQMALVVDGEVVAIANFDACQSVSNSPLLRGLATQHDLSSESASAAQTLQMERNILHDQVNCNSTEIQTVDRPEVDVFVPSPNNPVPPPVSPEPPTAEQPPIERPQVEIPQPEPEPVTIPEREPPTAEIPQVDIPDIDIDIPEVEIPGTDVPRLDLPQTGNTPTGVAPNQNIPQ